MGAKMGQELQKTKAGDILPASMDILSMTDVDALGRSLTAFKKDYDLAVIDAPPSLGKPLLAVLRAATEVLIPLQADPLSVHGLYNMQTTIARANPALTITGVFLSRHNGRSVIARDMVDAIRERCQQLKIPFIDTPIREGVAIREAQLLHEPIYTYAPRSNPAKDFKALLDAIQV
jgi:chromosome partitioning protein